MNEKCTSKADRTLNAGRETLTIKEAFRNTDQIVVKISCRRHAEHLTLNEKKKTNHLDILILTEKII